MSLPAVADSPSVAPLETPARRPGADLWRAVARNRKAVVGALLLLFFFVLAIFPGQIAPYPPTGEEFGRGLPPSSAHWFGTTAYGQDVLSQLIWGTRQSLAIAFAVGGLATLIAVLIGVSAAYFGGFTDGFLSLVTDVILVIPIFPLIIVIAAYERNSGMVTLVIVLGLLGWSYGARQLRSQALSLRNRDFLEAARVRGERGLYVVFFEILPTMTSLIVASFLGAALYAVLFAAGLQFIGLGDPNSQSWGTMLYWAENNEALGAGMVYWAIMPGSASRSSALPSRCSTTRSTRSATRRCAGGSWSRRAPSRCTPLPRPRSRPIRTRSSRCAASRSRTPPTPGLSWPSTTSISTSAAASSSGSSASRVAASRRCCTQSRGCSARRSRARSPAARSSSRAATWSRWASASSGTSAGASTRS